MSVAVAGLWELGHNVPLSEAGLWDQPLRDFGVDEWHMSPVTGINVRERHPELTEHPTVEGMVWSLRERFNLVWVTEDAEAELSEFEHPRYACYVFGKANWSPFLNLRQPDEDAVHIRTTMAAAGLWPHQCMTVVLWHRGLQWP